MDTKVEEFYSSTLRRKVTEGNQERTIAEAHKNWWIFIYKNGDRLGYFLTTEGHVEESERNYPRPLYKAQIPGDLVEVK